MPFYRPPEIQSERGQAGEQRFYTGRRYNFANLYQMNRSDEALNRELQRRQKQADRINETFRDQVNNLNRSISYIASNSDRYYTPQSDTNIYSILARPEAWLPPRPEAEAALAEAKALADSSRNFSVENEAIKAGMTPRQAAMLGFYAGVSNPDIQNIRRFSGIYDAARKSMGEIDRLTKRRNELIEERKQLPPIDPAVDYEWLEAKRREGDNYKKLNPSAETSPMNELDWALKTGRISADEYYAAGGGPGTAAYEALRDRFGFSENREQLATWALKNGIISMEEYNAYMSGSPGDKEFEKIRAKIIKNGGGARIDGR